MAILSGLTIYRCHKYKNVIKKASSRYATEASLRSSVQNCSERMCHAISSLHEDRRYERSDRQQPNILYIDGLAVKPFWSDEEFVSDIGIIESETESIIHEFENVYNNVWPTGWLLNNTPAGEWAVFHLINQGSYVKGNCEKCPKTFELLQRLVGSMSTNKNLFGNASFSVVQSGTDIAAHYGPTNARIRCHLGLKVSDSKSSYIEVDGKRGGWKTGKCLLFDDSFLHKVHHTDIGNEPRAVLLVDMWHPELTDVEKDVIDNLFKYRKSETPTTPTIPLTINVPTTI